MFVAADGKGYSSRIRSNAQHFSPERCECSDAPDFASIDVFLTSEG